MMSNGANVQRGHDFEREIKDHFVKAGWSCMRAARSATGGFLKLDLIAYKPATPTITSVAMVLKNNGYRFNQSKSKDIPLPTLASKLEENYFKHVYFDTVADDDWIVVLMQCKIGKRPKRKKR